MVCPLGFLGTDLYAELNIFLQQYKKIISLSGFLSAGYDYPLTKNTEFGEK